MAKDIVADFVRRMREQHPEVPDLKWRRLEADLRLEWGGERFYVPKASSEGKACSLVESLAAGRDPDEARAAIGVSRFTWWRWRRRGWIAGYQP